MRSINKVILIGNLTRDPEIKQTANGQPVTTFGMATNREWTTKAGERRSLAEYHNIAAWGRLAEICSKFLKKGKLVYVEGYLKTRSWDTDTGVRVFKTEIVIYDMIMLDKRPDDYVPDTSTDVVLNDAPDYSDEEIEESTSITRAAEESLSKMMGEGSSTGSNDTDEKKEAA